MARAEQCIYVYDSFSEESPLLLGRLYVNAVRSGEVYSFEYEKEWLKKTGISLQLDPHLMPVSGRQYSEDKRLFGFLADSAPDRWGETLMKRRERILAEKEGRKPRQLYKSDFLLGVFDETRMGGLRFRSEQDGPFVSDDKEMSAPPWSTLRNLEAASRNFEKDEVGTTEKWLNQLIRPGSSLGGARPKATVVDTKGEFWIAKFPSKHDENDTGAWEMVAHDLAEMCGLNVPPAKLEHFSKIGSTYLVKRFDRDGQKRVHFASAMTVLGKQDGASAADGTGYMDIVSFVRSQGVRVKEDLLELWKRIVFNMAISNTDDHLRNHAFLLTKDGWTLSPLFDVNPIPYGDELHLNVDEMDNRISIELAVSVAPRFGIEAQSAEKISDEMIRIVRENWKKLAAKYGLSRGQIENMRPAFQICEL